MRVFLAAMIAAFPLSTCISAHAHGDDKPKRGGTMGRGDDSVSIELVMEEGVVALHVGEHANHAPISSERMKGWLSLVARGGPAPASATHRFGRETLAPEGGRTPRQVSRYGWQGPPTA